MNGLRSHRTVALLAVFAFLLSMAAGIVYRSDAAADTSCGKSCSSGSCNCLLWCPSTQSCICWGLRSGEGCISLCIPDPAQLCDIP